MADNEDAEKALLSEAIKLALKLKVDHIELRHMEPLSWLANSSQLTANGKKNNLMSYDLSLPREAQSLFHWEAINCETRSQKVRMLLELPESSESLMKSFKSKLRSQIKKPLKKPKRKKF